VTSHPVDGGDAQDVEAFLHDAGGGFTEQHAGHVDLNDLTCHRETDGDRQTDRERHRQRETQTDRQTDTDRERHRQRDRQTDRQTESLLKGQSIQTSQNRKRVCIRVEV